MKKYIAEATGTFIITGCGTGAIILSHSANIVSHGIVSLVFGLSVALAILLLGKISGAHFNPAVSVAFALLRKHPKNKLLPYIMSQLSGAVFASLLLRVLFPADQYLGTTMPAGGMIRSFSIEYLLTFLLMSVILITSHGIKLHGFYTAIVVGTVVCFGAYFAGPVSGASMNPARSFGPAIVSGYITHLWLYIIAPIAGAISSVFVYVSMKKYLAKPI